MYRELWGRNEEKSYKYERKNGLICWGQTDKDTQETSSRAVFTTITFLPRYVRPQFGCTGS